jgi:hypothetical protein
MAQRREIEVTYTDIDGSVMVAIRPHTLGKRTRFYHLTSDNALNALHAVVESLVKSGTWTASPFHFETEGGGWHRGWEAHPYRH